MVASRRSLAFGAPAPETTRIITVAPSETLGFSSMLDFSPKQSERADGGRVCGTPKPSSPIFQIEMKCYLLAKPGSRPQIPSRSGCRKRFRRISDDHSYASDSTHAPRHHRVNSAVSPCFIGRSAFEVLVHAELAAFQDQPAPTEPNWDTEVLTNSSLSLARDPKSRSIAFARSPFGAPPPPGFMQWPEKGVVPGSVQRW